MKRKRSEAEIAAAVVAWLAESGWEVWQEVSLGYAEQRADIVARRGTVLWVVETKLAASFDLMDQAERWTGHAHMVSVATPTRQIGPMQRRVLAMIGVGYIHAGEWGVSQDVAPRFNRRITGTLERHLCDAQKTMARAGTNGGYYTPFRETMRAAAEYVAAHPGCTIKDLSAATTHHYGSDATARSCLARWAGTDQFPARVERDGKTMRLYPVLP